MSIDAKTFYNDFVKAVNENKNKNWKEYKNDKKWTSVATGLVCNIIRGYDLKVTKEYLRVDITGWKQRIGEIEDKAKKAGMKPWLWDLEIAVEHENKENDWAYELVKLTDIHCPLKVVIGYTCGNNRDNLESKRIAYAAELLQKRNVDENEDYLVILGEAKPFRKEEFDYRGYLYDSKKKAFIILK